MDDIGKVLHDRIKADFEKRLGADKSISAILKKIGSGKADFNDSAQYSIRLGELIKASILDCISPSDLPQEKMYYNIAKSILEPLLHDNYDRINAVCTDVQRALDKSLGIGLKPLEVDYPDERIRSALNGVTAKETAEESIDVLGRTAKNIIASGNDDYVEKNAQYRSKAGLDVFIDRKDDGNCCPWCSKLAGRYHYPEDIPEDVFKRHDNCGCLVSYVNARGGGRQNVHTKRDWSDEDQREYLKQLDEDKKRKREERKTRWGDSYDKVRRERIRSGRKEAAERERSILEKIAEKRQNALTNGGGSGIINAKISDRAIDLYEESGKEFNMQLVDQILNRSWVGQESVKYFDENDMSLSVYYNFDSDGKAGILNEREIVIFALYNRDEEAVASTIIHEISHERFNWKTTQEDEVNCYLMEAMHNNMGIITKADIKKIVKFVKKRYYYLPEGDLYGF